MNMLVLIIIFIFIIVALYLIGTRGFKHFKKSNVKHLKPFPFLGNIFQTIFTKDHPLKTMDKIYHAFPRDKYIGFFEFSKPALWLRDPEIIRQVTVRDFDHFTDHRNVFSDNIDPLFSNSLFTLRGQKWKDMRSTLSPAFTAAKIKIMYPLIVDCAKQIVDYYRDELKMDNIKGFKVADVETKDLFGRYANDVIASSVFGIEVNSIVNRNNDFYTTAKSISYFDNWFFIKYMLSASFPKLVKLLGIGFMKQEVANFFRSIVKQTMQYRQENKVARPDMIQLLMMAKNGNLEADENKDDLNINHNFKHRPWTDDELASQAFVFFLAAFENISTSLSYAVYEIATHDDVQKKLQEEIDRVAKTNDINSYESLSEFGYMDMFLLECLRLWPAELGIDRICVKPYILPPANDLESTPYLVKAGDLLFIPIRCIHRDPKYFPEPDRLIPERFSNENKSLINPITFIPFGIGPRSCIGSRLAMIEMKAVLIQMLSRFDFVVCSKTENPSTAKIEMSNILPANGMWVGLKLRKPPHNLIDI